MKTYGDGFIKLTHMVAGAVTFITDVNGTADKNDMSNVGRGAPKSLENFRAVELRGKPSDPAHCLGSRCCPSN
jgi:Na+/H+-dicarboxylate symporter